MCDQLGTLIVQMCMIFKIIVVTVYIGKSIIIKINHNRPGRHHGIDYHFITRIQLNVVMIQFAWDRMMIDQQRNSMLFKNLQKFFQIQKGKEVCPKSFFPGFLYKQGGLLFDSIA